MTLTESYLIPHFNLHTETSMADMQSQLLGEKMFGRLFSLNLKKLQKTEKISITERELLFTAASRTKKLVKLRFS